MDTGLVPNQLGSILDWLKGKFQSPKQAQNIPLDPIFGEKFNDQPTVMAKRRAIANAPKSEEALKGLINPSLPTLNQQVPFYAGHMPAYTDNDLMLLESLRKPTQGI